MLVVSLPNCHAKSSETSLNRLFYLLGCSVGAASVQRLGLLTVSLSI